MDENFEVTVGRFGRYAVVTVVGEVDVATAPRLREGLDDAVDDRPPVVVVDLSQVTFIDSTALGVLIETSKRCAHIDLSLRIVVSADRIRRIFEITGLVGTFELFPGREEAIAG